MLTKEKIKFIKKDVNKNGKATYPLMNLSETEIEQLNKLGYEITYVDCSLSGLYFNEIRYINCPEISRKLA